MRVFKGSGERSWAFLRRVDVQECLVFTNGNWMAIERLLDGCCMAVEWLPLGAIK